MNEEDSVPGIVVSPFIERFFDSLDSEERLAADLLLFSILAAPDVDGEFKFAADYYPFTGTGTIELLDADWYVAYRVADNGDVLVGLMKRASELG